MLSFRYDGILKNHKVTLVLKRIKIVKRKITFFLGLFYKKLNIRRLKYTKIGIFFLKMDIIIGYKTLKPLKL
jgi:hypothetical protein